MLYHIRSGRISERMHAENHKQAAIKILSEISNREDLGICTIVSKKIIKESNSVHNVYFLTDNILDECFSMKLVG